MVRRLSPETILFLGDLVDGGYRYILVPSDKVLTLFAGRSNEEDFESGLKRLERILYPPEGSSVLHAVGNHDIGSSYPLSCEAAHFFKASATASAQRVPRGSSDESRDFRSTQPSSSTTSRLCFFAAPSDFKGEGSQVVTIDAPSLGGYVDPFIYRTLMDRRGLHVLDFHRS